MNIQDIVAGREYRPVIDLSFELGETMTVLAATFTTEAGPWHFQVPNDARKPYCVESQPLGQTLIVPKQGQPIVGSTDRDLIQVLKAEDGYRHFVDHGKWRERA